jgi:hypothetical protein
MIDGLVQSQIDDVEAHGQRWFLMDYANAAPFRDESGRSVFVDGEIALVLGARRFVRDDADVALAHRARVEALAAQFERSPGLVPESYPDEAWLFCNTNALVAIRMADVLDGTDHQALIDRWVANARARLVEPETGLLGSEFTWSGDPQDGPEGSSLWLVAVNLRLLDPAFAREQYDGARDALVRDVLGFGYAREWGAGWQGPVDVDSGPLVPILEASPSSSGFALMAAKAFGDARTYASLTRSLGAADLVTTVDPRVAALAANPMGDVIVLHALTFGPLWEKVGGGRPISVAADLGVEVEQVDAELDRPWPEPMVGVTGDGEEAVARSCAQRLALGSGFEAWDEYRTWEGATRFLRCSALAALRTARPATVSYVAAFRLDPSAVDQLPPTIGWTVSDYAVAAAEAAAAEGRPWSAVEPLEATVQDEVTLQVRGAGFVQTLQVLARGDFDADGAEDLLLASRQAAEGGSLQIVSLHVVTRTEAGGPMRIVRTVATGG